MWDYQQKIWIESSPRSIPLRSRAAGWGWPSAVRLWNRTVAGCGQPAMTDQVQLFISRCPRMQRIQHWPAKDVFRTFIWARRGTCRGPSLIAVSSTMLRIGVKIYAMAHESRRPIRKQESAELPTEMRRHCSSLLFAMPCRMSSFRLAVAHG